MSEPFPVCQFYADDYVPEPGNLLPAVRMPVPVVGALLILDGHRTMWRVTRLEYMFEKEKHDEVNFHYVCVWVKEV